MKPSIYLVVIFRMARHARMKCSLSLLVPIAVIWSGLGLKFLGATGFVGLLGRRQPRRGGGGLMIPCDTLRRNLEGTEQQVVDARSQLLTLAAGHAVSQALHVFVRYRIPQLLEQYGPLSVPSFMAHCGATTEATADRWRALVGLWVTVGVLEPWKDANHTVCNTILVEQQKYSLTRPLGEMLLDEGVVGMLQHWMEEPLWNAWGALGDSLVVNDNQTTAFVLGNNSATPENYYAQYPTSLQHANVFVQKMAAWETEAVVQGYDWSTARCVVDLGGHDGALLRAIHRHYPHIRGICVDTPAVVARYQSDSLSTNNEDDDAITLQAGDFFRADSLPQQVDVLLMKHIVFCDWNETASMEILRNCRQAVSSDARLVIAEAVLLSDPLASGQSSTLPSQYMNVLLTAVGGRSSALTLADWERVAHETGWTLKQAVDTGVPTCSLLVLDVQK